MITDRILDILVIEDDMNATLIAEKIKNEFHDNVRIHRNGKGILNDLSYYKDLDLIIVDQQFSKEDVVDTLRTVRKKSPYTEVIVLSSENESKLVNTIKEAGAYDYIYKDRSALDKVLYTIKAFWSNKRLQSENRNLQRTQRKSRGAVVIMVLVVLAIVAIGIYLITR